MGIAITFPPREARVTVSRIPVAIGKASVKKHLPERMMGDSIWPSTSKRGSAKGDRRGISLLAGLGVSERGTQSNPIPHDEGNWLSAVRARVAADPENMDLRCKVVRGYLHRDNHAMAQFHLDNILEKKPQHQEARYLLAVLCGTWQRGDRNRPLALSIIMGLLKEGYEPLPQRSNSPERCSTSGEESLPISQDLKGLFASCRSRLRLDPKNADLRCEMARLYLRRDDYDMAHLYLGNVLEERPDHQETRYLLAQCYGRGLGLPPNEPLAISTLRELSREGYVPAARLVNE